MSNTTIKRIINKDIKEIEKNKLNDLGIYIYFDENNMLEAKAMIVGPRGTHYEGGILFFKIFFPKNYPHSPPDLCYVSRNRVRIHPNLYTRHHKTGHGKVCLSILGTWSGPSWTSIMDISTVLITIQSLLDNKPLLHEPDVDNPELIQRYNEIIEHENIKTLFIENTINPPEDFKIPIFLEAIEKNKEVYKDILFDKIQNKNQISKLIKTKIYHLDYIIDYNKLKQYFKEKI